MKERLLHVLMLCVGLAALAYWACDRPPVDAVAIGDCVAVGRLPRIRPDYSGIVIPPNIAPLSFVVDEPGVCYYVEIRSERGENIRVTADTPSIRIPPEAWRKLLEANHGGELQLDVHARAADGSWHRFNTLTNTIAEEEIDGCLTYRLIGAGYNLWGPLSIRQRNLENYDESIILANRPSGQGCLNCHTFWNNGTERMILQFGGGMVDYGSGMLLVKDGMAGNVDTRTATCPMPAGYASCHPSGELLAFSVNKVRQFFHSARTEVRDVVDLESDLAAYVLETNSVTSSPGICDPDLMESYPAWSADGKHLYFCRAPILWTDRDALPPERYDEVRYDLMRVSFDLATLSWGEPETVLSATQTGQSIMHPRPSPDGRFLLFSMCEYGCFPIYHRGTDLYLMDLASGDYRRLECNSDECDSWHCWSSSGRWIAFSSKRGNRLFARPYFSCVDEEGRAHKPFVMPQSAPEFYDSLCVHLQRAGADAGPRARARGGAGRCHPLLDVAAQQRSRHRRDASGRLARRGRGPLAPQRAAMTALRVAFARLLSRLGRLAVGRVSAGLRAAPVSALRPVSVLCYAESSCPPAGGEGT